MGKTSWETARILGVSESTVNFHLCNACEKLGVRGRRAAVVAALRLGLIQPVTA
ncbi:LuxR C-terminal-related transcriptional regulator [Achromobacter anxifer]